MAILNFMCPIFIFVFKDTNYALNKCLGKNYLMFFLSGFKVCPDNEIFCWVCFTLYLVTACNIIDIYCTICCLRDIEKGTEKSRNMLSRQSYSNRKRYKVFVVEILNLKDAWGGLLFTHCSGDLLPFLKEWSKYSQTSWLFQEWC